MHPGKGNSPQHCFQLYVLCTSDFGSARLGHEIWKGKRFTETKEASSWMDHGKMDYQRGTELQTLTKVHSQAAYIISASRIIPKEFFHTFPDLTSTYRSEKGKMHGYPDTPCAYTPKSTAMNSSTPRLEHMAVGSLGCIISSPLVVGRQFAAQPPAPPCEAPSPRSRVGSAIAHSAAHSELLQRGLLG